MKSAGVAWLVIIGLWIITVLMWVWAGPTACLIGSPPAEPDRHLIRYLASSTERGRPTIHLIEVDGHQYVVAYQGGVTSVEHSPVMVVPQAGK
jgi:hypothetical protein